MDTAANIEAGRTKPNLRHYLLAVGFALLGGFLGILGAFVAEGRSTVPFALAFIGAPIVEEMVKPIGIYIFLIRWPGIILQQRYIAVLAALSGLCFGLLESLVYVTVYVPDHSREFFIYRFTVTVFLHTAASFIAGLGINARLIDWANGEAAFPRRAAFAFGIAIGLHAAFNTTVVVLTLLGVLTLD